MSVEHVETPEVVCGAEAADCKCGREPGHDGAHECARDGGQWLGVIDTPSFEIVRFPSMEWVQ